MARTCSGGGATEGFDPEALLHRGDPLTPRDPPRRIAPYHCGCGEAGCGTLVCRISESDGIVRWSGFRDFVGLNHPLDLSVSDEDSRPVDLPDLAFDATQYRAEVERAKADRSWETPRRRLARLLRKRLANQQERWAELGVNFRSVWVSGEDQDVFAVNLDRGGDQLLIGIRAPWGADEETALDAMETEILAGNERTWFVIYDQRRPSPPVDPP